MPVATDRRLPSPDELRRIRHGLGLTVGEVGDIAGVDASTVSRCERGLSSDRVRRLVAASLRLPVFPALTEEGD